MPPEELAARHPYLYHVTELDSWTQIFQQGLLSASRLLDRFEVTGERRTMIETQRRITAHTIHHSAHGKAVINDNLPLSDQALVSCLLDGLQPTDWYKMLNARVFFWADEKGLQRLLQARLNRNRARDVLVIDTLSFAQVYAEHIELSPINSGSTIRRPAQRGVHTYTPLLTHAYRDWQRLRRRVDAITEVVVKHGIPDIANYVIEVRRMQGESVLDIRWKR